MLGLEILACLLSYIFIRTKESSKKNSVDSENQEKTSSIDPEKELKIIESKLSDLEGRIENQEKTIKKLLTSSE